MASEGALNLRGAGCWSSSNTVQLSLAQSSAFDPAVLASSQTAQPSRTTTHSLPRPQREPPKRHCWECLRRRLVCDGGQPFCHKCDGAGVVCPGYDDKKPLRWIANGTISSRPRKGKKKKLMTTGTMRPAGTMDVSSSAREIGIDRGTTAISKEQRGAAARMPPSPPRDNKSQAGLWQEEPSRLSIPSCIDLRSLTSDVVQAAYYCKPLPLLDPPLTTQD